MSRELTLHCNGMSFVSVVTEEEAAKVLDRWTSLQNGIATLGGGTHRIAGEPVVHVALKTVAAITDRPAP